MYLKKTIIQKPTCTPVFTAALFTIAKARKQPKCSSTEERIKTWYIHITEYYAAIKKERMPSAATWMGLEMIIRSEVRQSEKDKHHMILLVCGI